jgi:hypothetical protein
VLGDRHHGAQTRGPSTVPSGGHGQAFQECHREPKRFAAESRDGDYSFVDMNDAFGTEWRHQNPCLRRRRVRRRRSNSDAVELSRIGDKHLAEHVIR